MTGVLRWCPLCGSVHADHECRVTDPGIQAMSTTFLTSIDVPIPKSETARLRRVLRKAAGTSSCDVWLPWTHRTKGAPDTHIAVYVRHEVGLAAGQGAQSEFAVARKFVWAIREAFDVEPEIMVINLDKAKWTGGDIHDHLVDAAHDANVILDQQEKRSCRTSNAAT